MKRFLLTIVCLTTAVANAGQVHAGVIISPTAVIANQLGVSAGTSTTSAINQSGLSSPFVSGVTDFDTYDPTTITTGNMPSDQWLGASPPINIPGSIDYDLGGEFTITRLALWNDNFINGMNNFTIFIDSDSSFGSAQNLGTFNVGFDIPNGQVVDINDGTGRYVRFLHNTFHGNRTSYAEIAFDTANATVPEPTTLAIFGIGALGLVASRRRRKVKVDLI